VKIFKKMSFRIHRRDTKLRFVTKFGENRPLRSPKGSRGLPNKKTLAPRDSSQLPFWPKWADRSQNFLNVVTLDLSTSTYTEFGPDRLRFAGLILEKLIFRPKVNTNIGFTAYKERKFVLASRNETTIGLRA